MGFSASTLTAAIESNILDHARAVAIRSPQIELHDEPDLLWLSSGIAHPYLNRVYRALFRGEDADERVAETLAYFELRRSPVSWHVGPSSEPSNLADSSERAGLTRLEDEVGMALEMAALPVEVPTPPGLVVERVTDVQALRWWTEIVAVSFGRPLTVEAVLSQVHEATGFGRGAPWRLYLGLLDGKPVGTSRVFFCGNVAGVYHVATSPQARGRGIGTAMAAHALREARDLGYDMAVLRAARAGLGIYDRLGFRQCCTFSRYAREEGEKPVRLGNSDKDRAKALSGLV
jgi:ribosomal protein S18 acetylase RimI-like enzyme